MNIKIISKKNIKDKFKYSSNDWKELQQNILKMFFRDKEDIYNSLEYGKIYMFFYLDLIRNIADKIYYDIFGTHQIENIAFFSFGSPSRYEMLGESDLDLLIVRKEDNEKTILFQNKLIEALKPYEFSKIDIPDWGTLNDCEAYLKNAITEANQIIESKFIWGDKKIKEEIENMKRKYCSQYRFEKTFVFQYLYFNQYYSQRGRKGELNLKYGHGGTRDFMFPVWFSNLRDGIEYIQDEKESSVLKSIESLFMRGDINFNDKQKFKNSVNFIAYIRNELLRINKGSSEDGKTFVNDKSIKKILKYNKFFESESEILKLVNEHTNILFSLKQISWDILLKHFKDTRSKSWNDILAKILSQKMTKEDIEKLEINDEILNMFLIWYDDISDKKFETYLLNLISNDSWVVLTSLVCHPKCPSKIIDKIVDLYGMKKGFEYILRVSARNKNTLEVTVKKIAENPNIEWRFKEPAIIRLKKGLNVANQL